MSSLVFFITFPMSDITRSHSGEFEFVAIFTGSFRNLELMEVLELTFFPHVFQFAARTSEIQTKTLNTDTQINFHCQLPIALSVVYIYHFYTSFISTLIKGKLCEL